MIKHAYTSDEDRQSIIDDNPGKVIVKEASHFDESYLVLDEPRQFDLTGRELKAVVLALLDELNELRAVASLPAKTTSELKQAIKTRLNPGG